MRSWSDFGRSTISRNISFSIFLLPFVILAQSQPSGFGTWIYPVDQGDNPLPEFNYLDSVNASWTSKLDAPWLHLWCVSNTNPPEQQHCMNFPLAPPLQQIPVAFPKAAPIACLNHSPYSRRRKTSILYTEPPRRSRLSRRFQQMSFPTYPWARSGGKRRFTRQPEFQDSARIQSKTEDLDPERLCWQG